MDWITADYAGDDEGQAEEDRADFHQALQGVGKTDHVVFLPFFFIRPHPAAAVLPARRNGRSARSGHHTCLPLSHGNRSFFCKRPDGNTRSSFLRIDRAPPFRSMRSPAFLDFRALDVRGSRARPIDVPAIPASLLVKINLEGKVNSLLCLSCVLIVVIESTGDP